MGFRYGQGSNLGFVRFGFNEFGVRVCKALRFWGGMVCGFQLDFYCRGFGFIKGVIRV